MRSCGLPLQTHVVIVVMQLWKRAWLRSSERLEDKLDFDPRIAKSGRGVLFSFPSGVIERVRRAGVRRLVSEKRYFSVRAFAAVLCTVQID